MERTVKYLEQLGNIYNLDTAVGIFGDKSSKFITCDELQEKLEEKDVYVIHYSATAATQEDYTKQEREDSIAKIVVTTVLDTYSGYPLCIGFSKDSEGKWVGIMVGTQLNLFRKYVGNMQLAGPKDKHKTKINSVKSPASKNVASNASKSISEQLDAIVPNLTLVDVNNSVAGVTEPPKVIVPNDRQSLVEIYNTLFYKERWLSPDGKLYRLNNYISTLKRKLEKDIKEGNTQCVVFNKRKTKVIFNSRLMDSFGNYIHLMSSLSVSGELVDAICVRGMQQQYDNDFNAQMLTVPPVQFYATVTDLIFTATMSEIDLTNMYSLNHIINERRDRFPEHIQSKSSFEIANAFKTAIEYGVKMAQVDYKFVVPMYNIEFDKLQFLLPIYFTYADNEKPELVVVLDKYAGFWHVRTVLEIESAYQNARVLSSPDSRWLALN